MRIAVNENVPRGGSRVESLLEAAVGRRLH
jgi:hypothetical protein